MIEIGFVEGNKYNLFDYLVMKFSRSQFSHVFFKYNNIVIEAKIGVGVRRISLQAYQGRKVKYCILPNDSKAGTEKAWLYACTKLGNKYDIPGVIGWWLGLYFLERNNRYFCSELILTCLHDAGFDILPEKSPAEVSPEMLYQECLRKEYIFYEV